MNIDVVIIGLNCAATLADCINSVLRCRYTRGSICVIYVDSGSTDASLEIARNFEGVTVLQLDAAYPTPGAARNLGWRNGSSPLVQFLDSDTVMNPDWLTVATDCLDNDSGAIRGLRKERYPERSIFNWIADQEWNAPPGDCDTFGGDALVRREVLVSTGGYDEELVGGEDPELSERVRQLKWKVKQLGVLMTQHDLAMFRWAQYWRRAYRTGYGYAAVAWLHGDKGFWMREVLRIVSRGGLAPLVALTGLLITGAGCPWGGAVTLSSLALVFQPFLLRQGRFRRTLELSRVGAMAYAIHCSIVVVPECFGVIRFWLGEYFSLPLRNSRQMQAPLRLHSVWSHVGAVVLMMMLASGCTIFDPGVHDYQTPDRKSQKETFNQGAAFQSAEEKELVKFANSTEIEKFSASVPTEYLIGPGDVISIIVRGRPDVTLEGATVSPDGKLSIPRVGIIDVSGQTVDWVTTEVKSRLSEFYTEPDVTVLMHEFHNNKVFVLGRVDNPGLINFKGNGTLLEAIAMAGGMSTTAQNSFLSKAVIFRGKEMVIWVDLMELLNNGNMSLNARLKNNDLVFIPESHDELVYVMGEVRNPGAIKLTSEITILDAIMMSGAPTMDAKLGRVYLIRYEHEKGVVQEISLQDILGKSDLRQNYILRDGDIVYVSPKALRNVNYVISSLSPSLSYLDLARSASMAGN